MENQVVGEPLIAWMVANPVEATMLIVALCAVAFAIVWLVKWWFTFRN